MMTSSPHTITLTTGPRYGGCIAKAAGTEADADATSRRGEEQPRFAADRRLVSYVSSAALVTYTNPI